MARQRKCKVCPEWHDMDQPWPAECWNVPEPKRAGFPTPYTVSDVMQGAQSQLDGKMYDSKSQLRKTYRDAGVIEVGNDPARLRKKERTKPDKQGIRDSIKKAAEIVSSM